MLCLEGCCRVKGTWKPQFPVALGAGGVTMTLQAVARQGQVSWVESKLMVFSMQ